MTPRIVVLIIAITITLTIGVLLAGRDAILLASPRGRCIARVEPVVLIGFAPSLTAELDCA